MKLNVSDIQHFSVGDGDGIRTTVFLKGCNLRCPWCHNPETQLKTPQVLNFASQYRTKLYGRQMTVEEVMKEVLLDVEFYHQSGGGVTVSGGEALLQANGVIELCKQLYKEKIAINIDTAGAVPYEIFEAVNLYTDTYLFDFKACNAEDYAAVIGGDFRLICDNIRKLFSDNMHVRIRIPLIPGFNMGEGYSAQMCRVLNALGAAQVDLLPFHRLGSGKYTALGLAYSYQNILPPPAEEINKIAEIYKQYFFVRIER